MRPFRSAFAHRVRPVRVSCRALTLSVMRGAFAAALALGGTAHAGNIIEELEELEAAIQDTSLDAEALYGKAQPGRGYITPAEAVTRFEDLLYLHMIGEHQAAAEGFFGLVTSAALVQEGLHRDAEWYLADSLFRLENYATAESRFQVVADDPQHPFRDDAVRRMLEIYAVSGNLEKFRQLYESEIVRGRVAPSDLITYSVARNFYVQDDLPTARARFAEIPVTSAYYGRARYHLGTFAVIDRDLPSALTYFNEVAGLSIETSDDRRVQDLALLALGRIQYELGDYLQAAEFYSRISADSEYGADKLYEISWTFIRTQAWQDALRGIDIFLLAYPDHEYAASLRVVKGKLHLAEAEYDDALASFDEVMVEYSPVRDQFGGLARDGESADRAYFQQILAISRSEPGTRLPPYAVSMMQADPDLSRAIFVFGELEDQEQTIRTSEDIIRELKLALGDSGGLGSFEAVRYETLTTSWRGLDQGLLLVQAELDWQLQGASQERVASIQRLVERRHALTARAGELSKTAENTRKQVQEHDLQMRRLRQDAVSLRDEAEEYSRQISLLKHSTANDTAMDADTRAGVLDDLRRLQEDMAYAVGQAEALEARLASMQSGPGGALAKPRVSADDLALLEELHQLRLDAGRSRDPSADPTIGRRIDAAYLTLERAQERLHGVYTSLEKVERTELGRIQERFGEEVVAVAAQRLDHGRLIGEAEQVSAGLTREGFGRLEDFFARSVLDADLGAVDVFWAQKLETSDEIIRVQEERQALLGELDERFSLIKQKIGNAR